MESTLCEGFPRRCSIHVTTNVRLGHTAFGASALHLCAHHHCYSKVLTGAPGRRRRSPRRCPWSAAPRWSARRSRPARCGAPGASPPPVAQAPAHLGCRVSGQRARRTDCWLCGQHRRAAAVLGRQVASFPSGQHVVGLGRPALQGPCLQGARVEGVSTWAHGRYGLTPQALGCRQGHRHQHAWHVDIALRSS